MKEKLKENLKKLADEKYKQFQTKLCPGVNNIIGIRVPILRNYAKQLLKENKLENLLKQIDNQYYEEIMLQGMLIGLSKKEDIERILEYISEFIPKIDNWAICDIFCAGLKITNKNKKEMWEFINKYLLSEKEFELRFAIVMMLGYYIEKEYIIEILEKLNKIRSEKYYVQMAIAWAISICLIKEYNTTKKYLKTSKLDKFTHNKSIQKAIESYRITEEQKTELRKMKRGI